MAHCALLMESVREAGLRLAAHRALLELILRTGPRPLVLNGKEEAFCRMVADGKSPDDIADSLDLPADTVVAALWRLTT